MRRIILVVVCVLAVVLLPKSTECQLFDGIPGCRTTRLELVFLIDGSSSVSEVDFNLGKEWIRNMTLNFDISPATTRIAVVQYSAYPREEFGLNAFTDVTGTLRGISSIQYMGGSTQTGLALRYAIERVFAWSRDGAAKVVIVLSDGRSQDEVYEAATALHSSGIATFAVGVGDMTSSARVEELRQISSGPPEFDDNVFLVEDFRSIGQIQRRLIDAVCEQTVQECPTAKHDLTFVIDVSSSIGYEDFKKVKDWMKKIVRAFDIGPQDTRVAVIMYSTSVQEVFNFNALLSKDEVISAIDLMEYVMGDTNTGGALLYMLNHIYSEGNGDRHNVPDMAIVMTDGKAQETDMVIEAAKQVHEAGITVFSVGVGDDYTVEEVQVIATDPDENYVIQALNFDIIELKRRGLVKNICTQLEETCPAANAEIVFLVDGSSSIGSENFEKIKQWMKSIVDAFQVGPYYARVGVVQFTEIPYLEFGLNDYLTTQSTLRAIQNIRYRRGSTNIGRAIDFTINRVFSATRVETPKILIVLTDGESQDDVTISANRARQTGVHTLVFGVDNPQSSQIRAIVSETDSVFRAAGFDDIQRLGSKLVSLICVQAEPECAGQELDLHFLVDSSESIGQENFDKVKAWMKNVVNSFDIGRYTTRVAVTQYSATVHPEFNLREYATKREVEYAIEQLNMIGGPTMTSQALDYIRQNGFSAVNGGRQNAPKVLIVVSDGRSGDHFEEAARTLRESGVYVFSIGAGHTLRNAMQTIGSQPVVAHVQEASSFDVINRYRRELVGKICRQTKPGVVMRGDREVTYVFVSNDNPSTRIKQTLRKECPVAEMDLIFLVDGSTSVGRRDFETTKEWMISFVKQFEIGEYNTKIGLVQYSSSIQIEIDIGGYESKADLIDAISQIEFASGSTNTGSALEYIRNIAFSTNYGARKDVPKVLIVLTDGGSRDEVITAARQLSNDGVEVYAIGIGRANVRELNAVMTDSFTSNIYHVLNYDAIKTIQSGLLRRVCAKIEPDCGKTATDLMYLVDSSTSVGADDWEVMKDFMQNVTNKFKLSNDYVRVGVVQYSTFPRTSIEMGNYEDKLDLKSALSRMGWQSGNTYTARALRYVLRSYERVPPRPNVQEHKLLIVITDGQAQDRIEVIPAIKDLHNDGWRIFAIGIGEADLSELGILASNPDHDHLFYADDFLSTRKFQGRLTRLICGDPRYDSPASTPSPSNIRGSASRRAPRVGRMNQMPSGIPGSFKLHPARRIRPEDIYRRNRGMYMAYRNRLASRLPVTLPPSTTTATTTLGSTGVYVNSSCPVLWKNGRRIFGSDFLEILNIKSAATSQGAMYKAKRGSTSTSLAYRIKQGRILPARMETLLGRSLPPSFSLVAVFRMHGRTNKDIWTLMSVTASSGMTMFAVSFNGNDQTMFITHSSNPLSSAQTFTLEGSLVASLFDRNFHKMEIILDFNSIRAMVDCQQVADKINFDAPIFDSAGSVASFVVSQRSSTIVDIQDMTLFCGVNEPQQCCELPGKKCVPAAMRAMECGCMPKMKSPEIRAAETAKITKIATEIATQIVQEKFNELVRVLNLEPELLDSVFLGPSTIQVSKRRLP